jgi:hypothetical protein
MRNISYFLTQRMNSKDELVTHTKGDLVNLDLSDPGWKSSPVVVPVVSHGFPRSSVFRSDY